MKVITVAGPPSSGKTSVIIHTLKHLKNFGYHPCVIKFDCLTTGDDKLYEASGFVCKVGLSGSLCPDHYFVSNIESCLTWAKEQDYDYLITESAGLCNRCSPHINGVFAVCVIDNLMGIETPKKIGPMLKMADAIVITKGDVVSQAEREIFFFKILQTNPTADIINVNGITGQGSLQFCKIIDKAPLVKDISHQELRVCMPTALCSYCLGETHIGNSNELSKSQRIGLNK